MGLEKHPTACACRRDVEPFALKRSNQFVPPPTTTFLVDETNYDLQVGRLLWINGRQGCINDSRL